MEEVVKNIIDNMNLNIDYRKHIKNIKDGKNLLKKGRGTHFPSNPFEGKSKGLKGSAAPLLDRLELLAGSIAAGNNSSKVKNEFSKIVHVLRKRKLNVINNDDVINLLRVIL